MPSELWDIITELDPINRVAWMILDRAKRDIICEDFVLALDAFLWMGSPACKDIYEKYMTRMEIWDYLEAILND